MATWRDNLHQVEINGRKTVAGSFRGVPFRTTDAELQVGRRTAVHEYPGRDVPYTEDMGRRARRYTVDAYLLGDNYLAERDALIAALEQSGPGELVHPRYGRLMVALDGYVTIKEGHTRGGMATLHMTFVESGRNVTPLATTDTVSKVDAAAEQLDDATQSDFADNFDATGSSVLSTNSVAALQNNLKGILATAKRVTSLEGLTAIISTVQGITSTLTALIRTPTVLVQGLRSAWGQFVQALKSPLSAFAELQSLFASHRRANSTATTGTRARIATNNMAQADLQRRLALSNQARVLAVAISSTDYVQTADQALALRDALVLQIDEELEVNDPPLAVARALVALRAAVTRDVAERAQQLARRGTFTPQAVLPAVVLAHRLYQDATRADELAERNGVRNPAFVPVKPLEVLL